jgi:hypothetical protein
MSLKDWLTTAISNSSPPPYGAPENMTMANVNNVMRQIMADVRTLAIDDTIASAATCDLGTKDATFLTVTGTTTITGFGNVSAGIYKFVRFAGALTLTHNATSLILQTGANRVTVAGECGLYKSEGSGNWREYFYSQQLDPTLTALAGTLTAANKIPYATALDTAGELTLDTDGTLAANSDVKLATQKAVKTAIAAAVTFSNTAENVAGTVSTKSVSPLGIREAFNTTGTAPVYACRAWVNFNGTFAGNMTIANGGIRASGNVSSITDNGVGDYTINFTTAMQDVNYSVAGMAGNTTPTTCSFAINTNTFTTTAFRIATVNPAVALTDYLTVTLSIFR